MSSTFRHSTTTTTMRLMMTNSWRILRVVKLCQCWVKQNQKNVSFPWKTLFAYTVKRFTPHRRSIERRLETHEICFYCSRQKPHEDELAYRRVHSIERRLFLIAMMIVKRAFMAKYKFNLELFLPRLRPQNSRAKEKPNYTKTTMRADVFLELGRFDSSNRIGRRKKRMFEIENPKIKFCVWRRRQQQQQRRWRSLLSRLVYEY